MLFSHNELKSLDTYSAKPSSAPRPNDERDISCVPCCPTSLPQYAGYEARSCDLLLLVCRSDYRRPYPEINSAENPQSVLAAPRQWPQVLPPAAWCRGRWLGRQLPLTVRRQPRPKGCVLPRFLHDQWGLGRYSPPKTRLSHNRIGCLPLPVYPAEFLTIFEQHCPYPVQQTQLYPALKGAVDRAVVGQGFGQIVPLTTASHAEDNRIQSRSWVDAFPARVFGWVVLLDNWLYLVPQFVWYLPNCWQRFEFFSFLCHLRVLSFRVHRWFIGKIMCFEIVSK